MLRASSVFALQGLAETIRPMVGDMARPGLPPANFDLVWSEGALNGGIENALHVCPGPSLHRWTLGTLIGADILSIDKIKNLDAPVASIGGVGTFDGICTTGIIAVL